jgi:hypothetical protein
MHFDEFTIAKNWWLSMTQKQRNRMVDSLIDAKIINHKNQIVLDDRVLVSELSKPIPADRIKVLAKGAGCLGRCERLAAAVERNCTEQGIMEPGDCLDLALDAYECCAERCKEKPPA